VNSGVSASPRIGSVTNPGDTPFVLLAAYAPGFMAQRVTGSVTVGLLLALSKFVTTVAIMLAYARFTRKRGSEDRGTPTRGGRRRS
jgi:hypothetical protein